MRNVDFKQLEIL